MGLLPELRAAPPWVMEEMVAAEPDLARSILTGLPGVAVLGDALAGVAATGAPIAVVGCGTSEHAAMAVAALLRAAMRDATVVARQAFEAELDPWPGACLAISHEGSTRATVSALSAAAGRGALTAIVTAVTSSEGARAAEHALVTPLVDRSWCHTVGYLSPILAGATVAANLAGERLDGDRMAATLEAVLLARPAAEAIGRELARSDRLVITGSGLDAVGARELALKIEEGAHVPAVGRELETQLHGHLVSADARCGLVAIAVDPAASARRADRTADLLRAASRLGMLAAAIVSPEVDARWPSTLTGVGRLVLPDVTAPGRLGTDVTALAATAVAFQLLTLGIVHARGTNPDRIRREEEPWRLAAEEAERTDG